MPLAPIILLICLTIWIAYLIYAKQKERKLIEQVTPNTHYSENKGNNGRENAIKILNISLL